MRLILIVTLLLMFGQCDREIETREVATPTPTPVVHCPPTGIAAKCVRKPL
jgi:hypothetical protein